jgi:hypothetical protein
MPIIPALGRLRKENHKNSRHGLHSKTLSEKARAGDAAQGYSAYLTHTRPWV